MDSEDYIVAAAIDDRVCGAVCSPFNWIQLKCSFNQFLVTENQKLEQPWGYINNSTVTSVKCHSLFSVCYSQGTLHVLGKALKQKLPGIATFIIKNHPQAASLLFDRGQNLSKGPVMNYSVSLGSLSSSQLISFIAFNLGLTGDITSKLRAQEVDGRFLKDLYARGKIRATFTSSPFYFPLGIASKIESWVEESIRGAEEYDISGSSYVSTPSSLNNQTFIAHGNGNIQAGGNVVYSNSSPIKPFVSLEDIISQNHVWPNIGERIAEIRLELDSQLRKSSKPMSDNWIHRVTSAEGGPRGRTYALFSEAKQQMCIPELICAISKVLPKTGSYFQNFEIQIENPPQGPNMNSTMNPFVESMSIQHQTKSMLASTLLSQKSDVPLKKLVARLLLALGENDAWLKFAKAKGATSGAAAEERISMAQATGEPEAVVIPLIAQAQGYLAITFLSELKSMVNSRHVTEAVEKIEEHLVCVESSIQNKGNQIAEVNSSIRQWIIENELCDTASQLEIQARVDSLKNFEVTSLKDLTILEKEDFEKCGFRGVKAKKAFLASRKI